MWPSNCGSNLHLQSTSSNRNLNFKGSPLKDADTEWPLSAASTAVQRQLLFILNYQLGGSGARKTQNTMRNWTAAILRALLIGWRYRPMQEQEFGAHGRGKDNNPLCTKFEHEIRTHWHTHTNSDQHSHSLLNILMARMVVRMPLELSDAFESGHKLESKLTSRFLVNQKYSLFAVFSFGRPSLFSLSPK